MKNALPLGRFSLVHNNCPILLFQLFLHDSYCALPSRAYENRVFRQSVRRVNDTVRQTEGRERPAERLHRLLRHGLCPVHYVFQAAQIQSLGLLPTFAVRRSAPPKSNVILVGIELARRQAEGEVGRLQVRPAIFRYSLQPSHGALQEGDGRHVPAAPAAVNHANERTDESHIVVLGQPGHDPRLDGGLQLAGDNVQIVRQVGMSQRDALGRRRRSGRVLDEGNLVRFWMGLYPRIGPDRGRILQRLPVRHDPYQFLRPGRRNDVVLPPPSSPLSAPHVDLGRERALHAPQSLRLRVLSVRECRAGTAPTGDAHERRHALLTIGVGRIHGNRDETRAYTRQERQDEVRRAGRVHQQHAISPGQRRSTGLLRVANEGGRFLHRVRAVPDFGGQQPTGQVLHRVMQLLIRNGRGDGRSAVRARLEK